MHDSIFRTQTLFGPTISFDQNLFLTQNFFELIIFHETQRLGDFHQRRRIKPFQTVQFTLKSCEIHKPNRQIKTMLVYQSKQGSNQGQKRLSFWTQNIFVPKIFLDPKFFTIMNFFLDPKYFWTRFFFDQHFCLNHIFL